MSLFELCQLLVSKHNKNISKNDKNVLTNKSDWYNIPSTGKIISLADIRISRLDVHLVAGLVNPSVGMEEQDVKDTK